MALTPTPCDKPARNGPPPVKVTKQGWVARSLRTLQGAGADTVYPAGVLRGSGWPAPCAPCKGRVRTPSNPQAVLRDLHDIRVPHSRAWSPGWPTHSAFCDEWEALRELMDEALALFITNARPTHHRHPAASARQCSLICRSEVCQLRSRPPRLRARPIAINSFNSSVNIR
jgi:hypothetical protein